MPLPDYLQAALELAESAPRDDEGNLTDEGRALVQAALEYGKEDADGDEPIGR